MSHPERGIAGKPHGEGTPQPELTPQNPRLQERARPKKKVSKRNHPEGTKDKTGLTKKEQQLLYLLDDELALPPLPPDFVSNVLARLGIPSDTPSAETLSPETRKAEAEETAKLIFHVGKTPLKP